MTSISICLFGTSFSAQQFEDAKSVFNTDDNFAFDDEDSQPIQDDLEETDPLATFEEEQFYPTWDISLQDASNEPSLTFAPARSAPAACIAAPLMGDPTCRGIGLFLTGDALAWKVKQDGLAYTIKNDAPINYQLTNNYPNEDAEVKHFDFSWAAGFRAGLGYHFSPKKWDLALDWTWYQQHTHSNTHANDDQGLFAIWMAPTGLGNDRTAPFSLCLKSKAKWNLHYNVLDLDLGRFCRISRFFSIRPHGGIRSAWIHQDYRIKYIDFAVPGAPASGFERVDVSLENDFWGWGIRAGFDSAWIMWKSWSIFCDAAYSLLWGNFHLSNKEVDVLRSLSPVLNIDLKDDYHSLKSNFECSMGIRWDWMFNHDRCHFAFSLGWEEIIWFNQNQLNHLANADNVVQFFKEHGDLGLSGLTFNVRFDF